jgi:hypothetical protein
MASAASAAMALLAANCCMRASTSDWGMSWGIVEIIGRKGGGA